MQTGNALAKSVLHFPLWTSSECAQKCCGKSAVRASCIKAELLLGNFCGVAGCCLHVQDVSRFLLTCARRQQMQAGAGSCEQLACTCKQLASEKLLTQLRRQQKPADTTENGNNLVLFWTFLIVATFEGTHTDFTFGPGHFEHCSKRQSGSVVLNQNFIMTHGVPQNSVQLRMGPQLRSAVTQTPAL